AYEVLREGVDEVYREVFGSSMDMAEDALVALGQHPYEARRAMTKFRAHDEKFLRKSAAHAGDESKLVDIAKVSRAEISKVFAADRQGDTAPPDMAWHDDDGSRN
ncbi:MAG: potassium transporter, partial [Phyllobacteriaceae bacterium]|nr:potassium transporter [Phyllobacteriaceae bacterium]